MMSLFSFGRKKDKVETDCCIGKCTSENLEQEKKTQVIQQ